MNILLDSIFWYERMVLREWPRYDWQECMIHYAYNFCQAVEDAQEPDENLIQATERVADGINTELLLKTRDSLRELALILENIATRRNDNDWEATRLRDLRAPLSCLARPLPYVRSEARVPGDS